MGETWDEELRVYLVEIDNWCPVWVEGIEKEEGARGGMGSAQSFKPRGRGIFSI